MGGKECKIHYWASTIELGTHYKHLGDRVDVMIKPKVIMQLIEYLQEEIEIINNNSIYKVSSITPNILDITVGSIEKGEGNTYYYDYVVKYKKIIGHI